ncbi:MAG: hypothetical protein JKY60_19540, partial [Kordiimonadaceae bacterium]|nr:hypothetical protein [Kordiimonadaceae bacterium]
MSLRVWFAVGPLLMLSVAAEAQNQAKPCDPCAVKVAYIDAWPLAFSEFGRATGAW